MKKALAEILLRETARWGIRVSPRDGKLILTPPGRCPDELRTLLREHKGEILDLLQARVAGLSPDEAPWLHVARQLLSGEFDGCSDSTRESLSIGLRGIAHPVCKAALARLESSRKDAV